jgi:hypothetical protein
MLVFKPPRSFQDRSLLYVSSLKEPLMVLGRGSPAASGGESPAATPEVGGPGPLPHQGGGGGGDGSAVCACGSRSGGLRGHSHCLYPGNLRF